ncbi:Putative citrate transporter-like domain-containing protein [Colletotrichum destructivum]|uniref:Citrate transporter-like domain-containing protein n=1 Tax=Colletotrichum destructivum TaxID=34406 RepID=A0AAX4I310_9PEZI|nr:Putative citrate transporter-like domain-containing protein [Colletotrichum destructivum]
MDISTETSQIKEWRSIVTLIVFFLANVAVLFPFKVPLPVPVWAVHKTLDSLSALRIIPPREKDYHDAPQDGDQIPRRRRFVPLQFPVNSVTAPLIADLFLLAILAIGRKEVHDGTIGENGIFPIDIMIFFITLAYIAISIDASGLIRYLALKVLQWGGEVGHRLFFYLYAFFFCLGSFIGNDPIILSGTAFLAYMTRVSTNIKHPKAWIFTQFAIANISSAILVSSNPTNLVLAGAFQIKFIEYTANMVVPVVITAIILFPFLLYVVFANEGLIPYSIKMREAPNQTKSKPVNPNIPSAKGSAREESITQDNTEQLIEEIMNPWLDKGGAAFGAVVMSATLVTVLAINAASVKTKNDEHFQVFWVTLPAAFIMLCWDLGFGWLRRDETRAIARGARDEGDRPRAGHLDLEHGDGGRRQSDTEMATMTSALPSQHWPRIHVDSAKHTNDTGKVRVTDDEASPVCRDLSMEMPNSSGPPVVTLTPADQVSEGSGTDTTEPSPQLASSTSTTVTDAAQLDGGKPSTTTTTSAREACHEMSLPAVSDPSPQGVLASSSTGLTDDEKRGEDLDEGRSRGHKGSHRDLTQPRSTLLSRYREGHRWMQMTFPTVMAVISHLPFALVPFAFAMFVLVQALVTKGWVPVFAYGWDHWVEKTGTIGAIGGMGFLSVILCNFAGTNIGTTILLSRVIQAWQQIHRENGVAISDRTFWGTVYSMALGVNYGAFSTAFSASLAGLLWRDILERKHIHIRRMEFARENVPIITIAMIVGCTVLVGEIYIIRKDAPYHL